MARPESVTDIELDAVEFATVDMSKIATDGTFVKAYGAFMEACQKAGATVEVSYGSNLKFTREPSQAEQAEQLRSKQSSWDHNKKLYDQLAAVGEMEHEYMRSTVKAWAEAEGLAFPPPHEPIKPLDAVIRDIEEVVA